MAAMCDGRMLEEGKCACKEGERDYMIVHGNIMLVSSSATLFASVLKIKRKQTHAESVQSLQDCHC